jgi:hypothetical protein
MRRLDLDQARLGLADFDLFCLVLLSSQNKQYQAWVSFSRIFLMQNNPTYICCYLQIHKGVPNDIYYSSSDKKVSNIHFHGSQVFEASGTDFSQVL